MRTLFNNPAMQMMYENALTGLLNGWVNPIDKTVLSDVPLPPDFVDPYASQGVEAVTAINLAYNALTTWIEEAKKANYFSEHFVSISKLVMNGVTAAAKGLATLHAQGEALDQLPLNIEDLIGVGSYHIRKSYLGVLQTAKSHPDISERLLFNQLKWTDTLMRLYKTRDKLKEAPKIKTEQPAISTDAAETAMLSGETGNILSEASVRSLSEASPLQEPGRYAPHRAYSPIRQKGLRGGNAAEANAATAAAPGTNDDSTDAAALPSNQDRISRCDPQQEEPSERTQNDPRSSSPGTETTESDGAAGEAKKSPANEEKIKENAENETAGHATNLHRPAGPGQQSADFPEDHFSRIPSYKMIMDRVMERSETLPDHAIEFMPDEIEFLLSDPLFVHDHPQLAEKLRQLLAPPGDG